MYIPPDSASMRISFVGSSFPPSVVAGRIHTVGVVHYQNGVGAYQGDEDDADDEVEEGVAHHGRVEDASRGGRRGRVRRPHNGEAYGRRQVGNPDVVALRSTDHGETVRGEDMEENTAVEVHRRRLHLPSILHRHHHHHRIQEAEEGHDPHENTPEGLEIPMDRAVRDTTNHRRDCQNSHVPPTLGNPGVAVRSRHRRVVLVGFDVRGYGTDQVLKGSLEGGTVHRARLVRVYVPIQVGVVANQDQEPVPVA